MKLELTQNQIDTLQIALSEMFNTDTWTEGLTDEEVTKYAKSAQDIIKQINKNK